MLPPFNMGKYGYNIIKKNMVKFKYNIEREAEHGKGKMDLLPCMQ